MKFIEIALIVLVLLALFIKRLPDLAKSLGKAIRRFKDESRDAGAARPRP